MSSGNVSAANVTELLQAWGNGNVQAMDALLPLVYNDLRRRAAAYLRRERPNHTLETTALVNEAYLKLVDQRKVVWKNRGGTSEDLYIEDNLIAAPDENEIDIIALDEALSKLAALDPRQERLVE